MEIEVNLCRKKLVPYRSEVSAHHLVPWCERLMHFHEPLPPLTHSSNLYPNPVITTLLNTTPKILCYFSDKPHS